jgi:menaquinone-9 beta-reductase
VTPERKSRVAIVGAGPAGAAAGRHLATRGHSVTLIDRAPFPRDKTCGDWLTPAALSELSAMGLDRATLARLAPGHATVTATRLVSPDGRASTRESGIAGACIERRILDHLVRERALAAGCVPLLRTIKDVAHDAALRADFDHVVDARGATAGTANAIGLRGYWAVRKDAVDADAANRVEIHTDAVCHRGYGWIFPVHADADVVRFNLGVGLWREDGGTGHSVADFLDRFAERNAVACVLTRAASGIVRPVGYPVALGLWQNRVADGRVLRIGDAANLADPLTGDGIGNALASGRLLAEVIDASTGAGGVAKDWQRQYDTVFTPELRRALVLRQLLSSTMAKNVATRFLEHGAPSLGSRLHKAVFGETGYRHWWSGQGSSPPKRS